MSDHQMTLLAAALSLISLVTANVALFRKRATDKAAERFLGIEEQIVRSVMEEQGTAYSDAVLKTTERLVGQGMSAGGAVLEAQRIHQKHRV